MLKNRGAAIALAALVAVASYGLWQSTHHPPNQQTTGHSEQRAAQDIGPQSTDERIAFYTEVLAWFTGVLAIVSAIQGFVLFSADRTARTTADAAKAAADAAIAHSDVAGKQLVIHGLQTDIIEKQHAVGRMQFVATHRPKLRVRYFRVVNTSDETALIIFTIVNVGASDAKLFSTLGTAEFFAIDNPPTPMFLGAKEMIEAPQDFSAGATIDAKILLRKQTPHIVDEQWWERRALHAFGRISYSDILGNVRTTAFCRRYVVGRERFEAIDDPDYEYED